ncbi:MAG: DNA starvation/stationary phase protection protein [Candidatus Peregrinibacteria bacterium]
MNTSVHLQSALANTFALYAKVHSFHWNVTGPRFQELHGFFEEIYSGLWKEVDEIAELLRIEGFEAPKTLSEIIAGAKILECPNTPDADEMLQIIREDLETLRKVYITGAQEAEKDGNFGVESYLEEHATAYKKTLWMMKSMV